MSNEQYDTGLKQDALNEYTRALMEHQEKELRGAWRAGYDYLYVVSHCEGVSILRMYVPSNREKWPHSPEFDVERFDIAEVDDETIKEAIGNGR